MAYREITNGSERVTLHQEQQEWRGARNESTQSSEMAAFPQK